MSFVKYATAEILEVKTSKTRLPYEYGAEPGSTFQKFAALEDTGDINGYLYVRTRAISSRVNKNNDGWPSAELAKGYKTFVGRPLFVDHNNDDPKRTRGVVLDARLFVDEGGEKTSALDPYYASAPAAHLPPTHIETISEVDAKTFPKLAEAIRTGRVNSVSMGANIEKSICSVCENVASTPQEYCDHIKTGKGNEFEVTSADGSVKKTRAYEDCIAPNFFEQSFVFDPADETALFNGPVSEERMVFAKTAKLAERGICPKCGNENLDVEGTGRDGLDAGRTMAVSCENCGWYGGYQQALKAESDKYNGLKNSPKEAAGLKTDVKQPGDEDEDDKIKNAWEKDKKPNTQKPQSDLVTAPDKVDTLSNDLICPNCDSDDLQEDPDGIWRCPTCEYELPPDGFRSPDLEEAREMDLKQKVEEQPNEEGENETDVNEEQDKDKVTFEDDQKKKLSPVSPVKPMAKTINNNKTNGIISEMNWNTKPENVDFVVKYLGKVSGVQNLDNEKDVARSLFDAYGRKRLIAAKLTQLEIAEGIERFAEQRVAATDTVTMPKNGIHAGSVKIFRMLGLQGTATVHNAGKFAEGFDELPDAVKAGFTKEGNDITIDLNTVNPPPSQAPGMSAAEAAGTQECQVTLNVTPDQALPFAVKLFQAKGTGPVWSAVEEALVEKDMQKAMQLMMTAAVKQPTSRKPINPRQPQSTKDEKIVSDQLKPVEADRRVIKREESDDGESGVKRTETIIEETGELGGSLGDEPKAEETSEEPKAESTQEAPKSESQETETDTSEKEESERPWEKKKEPAYASVEEKESTLLLAMEAAKLASSIGVIPVSEELSYAAELEGKSEDVIRDRLETLTNLKTAGVLQKQARFTAVPQVPRLGRSNGDGTPEQKTSVEEYLSEVFM